MVLAALARTDFFRHDKAMARIATKIDGLAEQPRPTGSKKLRGADDLWRVRVGDYRVIYAIDDAAGVIEIRVIRHRKDAYDRP